MLRISRYFSGFNPGESTAVAPQALPNVAAIIVGLDDKLVSKYLSTYAHVRPEPKLGG